MRGADAPASPAVVVTDNSTRILAEVRQFHADHPGYRRTPGSTIPPGVEAAARPPSTHGQPTSNTASMLQNREITQ